MEALRRAFAASGEFLSSIIEWRSAATAPYFMLINTAFWLVLILYYRLFSSMQPPFYVKVVIEECIS